MLNHIDDINIAEEVEKCVYSCIRRFAMENRQKKSLLFSIVHLMKVIRNINSCCNMILYERGKYLEYYVSIGEAKNLYEQITGEYQDVEERVDKILPYISYEGSWKYTTEYNFEDTIYTTIVFREDGVYVGYGLIKDNFYYCKLKNDSFQFGTITCSFHGQELRESADWYDDDKIYRKVY